MQVSDEFFSPEILFYCRLFQLLNGVDGVRWLRVGRPGGVDSRVERVEGGRCGGGGVIGVGGWLFRLINWWEFGGCVFAGGCVALVARA